MQQVRKPLWAKLLLLCAASVCRGSLKQTEGDKWGRMEVQKRVVKRAVKCLSKQRMRVEQVDEIAESDRERGKERN